MNKSFTDHAADDGLTCNFKARMQTFNFIAEYIYKILRAYL